MRRFSTRPHDPRLDRAVDIVLSRRVRPLADGSWRVESQQWPGQFYRVRGEHCACPDATYRYPVTCKHRLAVMLVAAATRHLRAA